ncbi:MAG TPA: hypothetical protein VHB53_08750 [Solirubrobacterales bacterium]|nr:hypothetical protein [Solirubrobacterales bacterium]
MPSKLLVFNGGDKVKLFIHAYFSSPISGAIVTPVTFKKIHHVRYGRLADARVPPITGGSGSIVSFDLKIARWFRYKGHRTRPFAARCADGKLKVHVLARFEDGTRAETEIVRACRPKGRGRNPYPYGDAASRGRRSEAKIDLNRPSAFPPGRGSGLRGGRRRI